MKLSKIAVACLALCLVGSAVPLANMGEMPAITASAKGEEAPTSGTYYDVNWNFDKETGTLTISRTEEMDSSSNWNGTPPWLAYRESIKTVVIEEGVTSIEESAFRSCTALTTVNIPESVTSIGNSAFRSCTSLTSINIPSSVTFIDVMTFENCKSLNAIIVSDDNASYCDVDGVLYDKDIQTLIHCPAGKDSIVIPDSVTTIESFAFGYCTSLTSVNIPNNMKSIGAYAFYRCNLSSLTIPKTVETIYKEAFDSCGNATVTILNPECEFLYSSIYPSVSPLSTKVIIYGYKNSTAQTYFTTEANDRTNSITKYEFRIIGQESPEDKISGDLNGDGDLTVSDLIAFKQKLGKREALPKNCDLNGDGNVNVIDLALLKRALLNK